MTSEIEVKFIVNDKAAAKLSHWLAAWPHQHTIGQQLNNIYFDTEDDQLRCQGMGLRIRREGDSYEMTLKGKGNSIGGLHQCSEYNVPLAKPEPDIAQLPVDIWPQGTDLPALQARLQPRFSTHFLREKWLITYDKSEIEVAFDYGEVVAGDLKTPLQEVELELKSGQREALMAFAATLAQHDGLRLGSLSKAARGYRLAQGNPLCPLRTVPVLAVKAKATIEQGMLAALQLGLNHWQYHEELWLRGEPAALTEIRNALMLVRETLSLFGTLVPRKASAALRQSLTVLEDVLESEKQQADVCCFTSLSLTPQLAITDWLIKADWRTFIGEKELNRLQGSFKRFADVMLARIFADLRETFAGVQQLNQFQNKLIRLQRRLSGVRLLAGAYPQQQVQQWLDSWTALEQAITDQQEHLLVARVRSALKQPRFWKQGNR